MAKKPIIASEARSALIGAGSLIVVATVVADGTLGLIAGMIAFFLIVFAMTRIPIRYSMMGLAFFATTLPNPAEGAPTSWQPPFAYAGAALLTHLNTLDRGGFLGLFPVSAMEMLFVVLFLVYLHRKNTKSKIDGEIVPTPKPLIQLSYVSLATTTFTWMKGLMFGGDFAMSLWQVNAVIYLPIIFLLMQAGFRGPQDHLALAKVYIAAGAYKSALAVYVIMTIEVPADPETGSTRPAFATAHADSMLFAVCFVIIAALLLERADKQVRKLAYIMLPVLVAGITANNRRLAWVHIAVVGLMVFVVSRETPIKRAIRRAIKIATPFFIIYVIVGWNVRTGALFKPVRMIRSVVDAETDSSSQWREWENVNIISTFRTYPLFGSGYGHPTIEVVHLPAVSYPLERYIPHNSLLGLWGFAGLVGFAGLTLLWVVSIYFAMRAYHAAKDPLHRSAAIASFGAVAIYLLQCFGDIGLPCWQGIFMMGGAITVAGKLAVVTGQWQVPSTRKLRV